MLSKIRSLEASCRDLDPGFEQRQKWVHQVVDHTEQFITGLEDDQSQAYRTNNKEGKGILESPINDNPTPMEDLLQLFEENVERCGLVESHGGHMAYINSGGVFPSALGDYLADVVNPYSAVFHDSPGSVRLENMVINWIGRTFGFPEGFAGNLTSGGSASTILALATARDSKNVKAADFSRCVVYMTQISHYCVEKALNTIGMREAVRRTIPTDKSTYKMNAEELKIIIEKDKNNDLIPFLVYATAGTTDLGSIDPLNEIASIARQHSLWMHVDACYGGFFIMSNEAKPSFRGIERCDSLAVDPHKSLFIPYGCGCVIVRQGSKLKYSNALNRPAFYLEDSFKDEREDEPSPCHLSFELSRHFRGVRVWMPLKLFGLAPFRDALTEKILLARYFHEQLAERGDFQLGPYPELSVVVFRYAKAPNDTEKFNKQLLDSLMRDGRVALASTRLRGVYYLRMCVLCFRTHLKEVDLLLEMVDKNVETYLKSVSKKPWESQQLYSRG